MTQTVLLAEHELHVRHMLAFKLRSGGYSVVMAGDGDEAFELARNDHPHLVILDVGMTRSDGTPLHRALASEPATEAVPVIFLSSNESEISPAARAGSRATRILSKPIGPSELLRVVAEILSPTAASRLATDVALKRFAV